MPGGCFFAGYFTRRMPITFDLLSYPRVPCLGRLRFLVHLILPSANPRQIGFSW
jgi:hypothetical protein